MKLPAVINDNMVLQQNAEVPIWGTGEPGEQVTVTLGDQRVTATADGKGRWMVRLSPLKAGGPFEMTISGNNTVTLRNVLVGEVWVCWGQSNMVWPVQHSLNVEQEVAEAEHPKVRMFTAPRTVDAQPLRDTDSEWAASSDEIRQDVKVMAHLQETEGKWVVCSPQTVGDFSGTGYFFGRDLHKALGVPVGLINSSWGGTSAEVWTSLPTLQSDPDFKRFLDHWEAAVAECPQVEKIDRRALRQPAGLYQGMIEPLIPYAIKGVVCHQGEANVHQAYVYRKLFRLLIQDWRRAWGQGDFPFLFVQLQATRYDYYNYAVAEFRESQATALALPKTGMVVALDLAEPSADPWHPKNKQEVGRRLYLVAQKIAYGQDVVYSGPIYESMVVEGNKIRLRFKHADGGLVARGGEPLKGFFIAGPDRKFIWATEAKIEGNEIVVWSDYVAGPNSRSGGTQNPVAVRYAWEGNPVCNLYNGAGLPASPFRTDDWPGVTYDKFDHEIMRHNLSVPIVS